MTYYITHKEAFRHLRLLNDLRRLEEAVWIEQISLSLSLYLHQTRLKYSQNLQNIDMFVLQLPHPKFHETLPPKKNHGSEKKRSNSFVSHIPLKPLPTTPFCAPSKRKITCCSRFWPNSPILHKEETWVWNPGTFAKGLSMVWCSGSSLFDMYNADALLLDTFVRLPLPPK